MQGNQVNYNRKAVLVTPQLFQTSVIFKSPSFIYSLCNYTGLGISLHAGEFTSLYLGSIMDRLKPCYSKCDCPILTLLHLWCWHQLKLSRNVDCGSTPTYWIGICILTRFSRWTTGTIKCEKHRSNTLLKRTSYLTKFRKKNSQIKWRGKKKEKEKRIPTRLYWCTHGLQTNKSSIIYLISGLWNKISEAEINLFIQQVFIHPMFPM